MDRRWTSTVQVSRVKVGKTPHTGRDMRLKEFFSSTLFGSPVEALSSAEGLVLIRYTSVGESVVLGAVLTDLRSGDLHVDT